jgi:hypothetical protein
MIPAADPMSMATTGDLTRFDTAPTATPPDRKKKMENHCPSIFVI